MSQIRVKLPQRGPYHDKDGNRRHKISGSGRFAFKRQQTERKRREKNSCLHPLQIRPFVRKESLGLNLFGALELFGCNLTLAEEAFHLLRNANAGLVLDRDAVTRFRIKIGVPRKSTEDRHFHTSTIALTQYVQLLHDYAIDHRALAKCRQNQNFEALYLSENQNPDKNFGWRHGLCCGHRMQHFHETAWALCACFACFALQQIV